MAAGAAIAGAVISGASGIVGPTVGAAANKRNQQRTMEYNSAQAIKANQFEANQAERQYQQQKESWDRSSQEALLGRNFQEKMFDRQTELESSAYQRKVKDMRLAGINPMSLFMGGGGMGSGTPNSGGAPTGSAQGGAKGSSSQATATQNKYDMGGLERTGASVTTALQAKKLQADIRLTDEQVRTEMAKQQDLKVKAAPLSGRIDQELKGFRDLFNQYSEPIKKFSQDTYENLKKKFNEAEAKGNKFVEEFMDRNFNTKTNSKSYPQTYGSGNYRGK